MVNIEHMTIGLQCCNKATETAIMEFRGYEIAVDMTEFIRT